MQNFMKTILSAMKSWIKKEIKESAADWNQNDPSVDSYVKNRPFYTVSKPAEYYVQPETIYIDDFVEGKINIKLVIDNMYIVMWDGIEYECVCYSSSGNLVIGNDDCWGGNGGNGEPFLISNYNGLTAINVYETGTHTIAILKERAIDEIHKIDSKYIDIPKNVATTDNVQDAVDEIMEIIGDEPISNQLATRMNKEDPTGTGSFSMNRKADSAVGECSHAEGYDGIASGDYSHAEGYSVKATEKYSHAEGKNTVAITENVHVEGRYNLYDKIVEEIKDDTEFGLNYAGAIGYRIGEVTPNLEAGYYVVTGVSSNNRVTSTNVRIGTKYITRIDDVKYLSDGTATIQKYFSVLELTKNNSAVRLKNRNYYIGQKRYAHVVGNGDNYTSSNAHTLDWDGNAWYQGDIYVGSTSGTDRDEGSKKLATEDYVDAAISGIEIPEGGEISSEVVKEAVDEYLSKNPPAQGAPGKDGADGKTPVKGEDYFTPEDVQEIAEQAAKLVEIPDSGDYELPIANPETLGGVKPVAKGADMTKEVGVDELGGLWTAPGGGSIQLADFTVEEDVLNLVVPLADDALNYKSILIKASIKDTSQLQAHLYNIETKKAFAQLMHENGQVGDSTFATLVLRVDFYHGLLWTTFSTMGTYQWQSNNKYTFVYGLNKDYVANAIRFSGVTVLAGSTIVVEGIK